MSNKIEEQDNKEIKDPCKRDFVVLAASALAGVGAVSAVVPFIDSMNPAKDVQALSSIEVDISGLNPGDEKTVKWRGKPVFIKRRTKEELARANKVQISELRDPETDIMRTKKGHEEFLIMIGVCTHLGCVPLGNEAGDYEGWFCPCHGSHYDISGRIRKGPAPKNLVVPQYSFISDSVVKIG